MGKTILAQKLKVTKVSLVKKNNVPQKLKLQNDWVQKVWSKSGQ